MENMENIEKYLGSARTCFEVVWRILPPDTLFPLCSFAPLCLCVKTSPCSPRSPWPSSVNFQRANRGCLNRVIGLSHHCSPSSFTFTYLSPQPSTLNFPSSPHLHVLHVLHGNYFLQRSTCPVDRSYSLRRCGQMVQICAQTKFMRRPASVSELTNISSVNVCPVSTSPRPFPASNLPPLFTFILHLHLFLPQPSTLNFSTLLSLLPICAEYDIICA